MKPDTQTETKTNPITGYLLLSLTCLAASRLVFLLKAPLSNYGYDYGFYLYAISHVKNLSLDSFAAVLWGGYNNPLFYFSHLLHVPPALILNELYFLFVILLGLSMFWLFNKNRAAGIFSVLLVAFSLIQSEAYSMYLWKNLLALPFLVLSFKFLMKKHYWPLALTSLVVLTTHRTTAIIYLLTVGIYLIWELVRQKRFKLLFLMMVLAALTIIAGFYLLNLKSIILNLTSNNNYYVRTGLFLEGQNIFHIVWPYLLLSLPGIYLYIKNKRHPILLIFTFLCLAWFVFQLPFYRRFLIYLDLSMVMFAAYFLSRVNFSFKYFKLALAIILLFLGYRDADFSLSKHPLILPAEVQEIKDFSRPGFVLAVSANDAPWLLGYTHDVRLGAPGLFEDPHTYQQWIEFWNWQNQKEFLAGYPRPIYLYQRSYRLQGPINNCLKPLSENFFEYACP